MLGSGVTSKVAFAFVLMASVAASAGADRTIVGGVERVQNLAEATWSADIRSLGAGEDILFEDALRTGALSRLLVVLVDGTALTMGEMADVTIDRLIYNPDARRRLLSLRSLKGHFLLAVDKLGGAVEDEVRIDTPFASIGIRGTTVWGGTIDGGYGIFSVEGVVSVTTPTEVIELQEGEGVTITDPAVSVPVLTWGVDKVARALATVAFEN